MRKSHFGGSWLLVLAFISACGKGGNSDGLPGKSGSVEPAGSFSPVRATTANDPLRFNQGCVNPGEPRALPQIDIRLKVGSRILRSARAYVVGGLDQSAQIESTFTLATSDAYRSTNLIRMISGVPGFRAGQTFQQACEKSASGVTCETEGAVLQIPSGDSKNFCTGISSGAPATETWWAGTYNLIAGPRDLTAYKAQRDQTVRIRCGSVDRGEGTATLITVYATEIPSDRSEFCGGTEVFSSLEYKLKGGQKIAGSSRETLAYSQ